MHTVAVQRHSILPPSPAGGASTVTRTNSARARARTHRRPRGVPHTAAEPACSSSSIPPSSKPSPVRAASSASSACVDSGATTSSAPFSIRPRSNAPLATLLAVCKRESWRVACWRCATGSTKIVYNNMTHKEDYWCAQYMYRNVEPPENPPRIFFPPGLLNGMVTIQVFANDDISNIRVYVTSILTTPCEPLDYPTYLELSSI
jgi:hypothetical protein